MKSFARNFLLVDIPILIFASQLLAEIFVPDAQKPAFNSEGGPLELVEAVVIGLAVPILIYLCIRVKNYWLKLWVGIAALAAIYVTGEEISWGQHVFQWATPENWSAINDQNETNLHNTSTWLDQKPRILLEVGVVVGGIIIPALRQFMPAKLPEKFRDIYPDNSVVFTAAMYVIVKLSMIIGSVTEHHLFWRGSEVTEMYLYYFVFLYAVGRVVQWSREGKLG